MMKIKQLKDRAEINEHKKLRAAYNQFNKLLIELESKELTNETIAIINEVVDHLNLVLGSDKKLSSTLKSTQNKVIKLIEKEHKIVTKNHYRNTWMAVGMAVFGIPLGVAFGMSLGNMAFLSIGLPIGMTIGMAVGAKMDKKAFDEGRQIDLEIKY